MLQSNAWVNGFYTYLRLLMHRFVFVFKIGIHQVTKVGPVSWKKIFRAVDVELIWMNSCMCSRGALSEHSMSHPLSQITRAGWVIDMERVDQWSNVSRPVNHQPTRTEIMYTGYKKAIQLQFAREWSFQNELVDPVLVSTVTRVGRAVCRRLDVSFALQA